MEIRCPHCHFRLVLAHVKPGRFTPACSRCKQRFSMTIDAAGQASVHVLEERPASTATIAQTAAPAKAAAAAVAVAEAPPVAAPEAPPRPSVPALTGTLGGYVLEKQIGQGGMGAVYLARQVSLDRPVALKIMNPEWAHDPAFVARFTREAYAAAQLTHHNIVQIHDIGVERDVHFFSMELVSGRTLAAMIKRDGPLDPEVAASLALQAARGLKFAHDHGMIHRDVKPENLLINDEGVIKVADLGLVKTPDRADQKISSTKTAGDSTTTQLNVSMGTPAYMAPEQARDAATVDQRADIYALGCTMYDMVTGRPPFAGKTAVEVITKHQAEAPTPPEMVVKRVPQSLSAIIQKMIAKRPEDRYASMDALIKDLEEMLGLKDTGTFSPREEHAQLLERSVTRFNNAPISKLRKHLVRLFFGISMLVTVLAGFFGWLTFAGATLGFAVLTFVAYQLVIGITQKTMVFRKVRAYVFGSRIVDWLKAFALLVLATLVLWLVGLLWVWIGVAVLALGLAIAFHLAIDLPAKRQRQPALNDVQAMLKAMRLKGLAEDPLRHFVCKYAGNHWEEFYEAMFGYEAKMEARAAWGRGDFNKPRKKFASWRDGVIAWADRAIKARQAAREQRMLEEIEARSLAHKGTDQVEARRKAKDAAEAMVQRATEARDHKRLRAAETAALAPAITMQRFEEIEATDDAAARRRERARVAGSRTLGGRFGLMILGPQVRLVAGLVLLGACLLWLLQNDSLHPAKIREMFNEQYRQVAEPWSARATTDKPLVENITAKQMKPLSLPLLPERWRWAVFNSIAPGIAGLLLIVSSLWRGVKMSLLMFPAAAVLTLGVLLAITLAKSGHSVHEVATVKFMNFGPPAWQVSYAVGALLALFAFYAGREKA